MTFPAHQSLSPFTGFLLRKVSAASFQRFAETLSEHDLHPMHFGLLTMIDAEEPISQHDLGRRTGIDPSSMVARMEVLAERELVERTRNAEDRRSYEIRLSPAGRRLLGELRGKAREHGDRFFSPLTKAERQTLHELLAKLAAQLDAECETPRPAKPDAA